MAQLTAQQQANVDTVTNRLELKVLNDHTKFISDKKFAADFDYVKLWIDGLGQVSDARASTNTYRWSDIGYVIGCVEFSPVEHHNRIIAMILSYTNPKSSYYKNAFLLSSIKNALNDNLILPLRQHPTYFA